MEIHLFIIWEKAQWKKQDIISDIEKDLKIIKSIDVDWPTDTFSANLSKFYGKKLPSGSLKEKECGRGTFTVLIVSDDNPVYDDRTTSHGSESVNINIFDRKERFREWTNDETTPKNYHGSRIHGSNNPAEAEHDIVLMFGVAPDEIAENPDILGSKYTGNVQGVNGWESLSRMFYVLNHTVNYLVLRNYEYLPDKFNSDEHGDIDLLSDDLEGMVSVIGGQKVFKPSFRVHYKVKVSGSDVFFDFRHVGDGYYCKKWEKGMLQRKVDSGRGFPVMNQKDYKYSLLYHALYHKAAMARDYIQKLSVLFKEDACDYNSVLKDFLAKHNYIATIPKDLSVYVNEENSGLRFKLDRKIYYLICRIGRHLPWNR